MSTAGSRPASGWRRFAALTLLSTVVGSGALAQAQAPASAPAKAPTLEAAASVELGRRTYVGMCARCHGLNLVTQGIGFDLRKFPQDGRERFNRSVTNGIKAMPGFGSSLSPAQFDGLWDYIGSVNGWQ